MAAPTIRLSELSRVSRDELVKRWEVIYGSPPPRNLKRPLLERAVAWHLQAKMFGGHSAKTKRALGALQPLGRAARDPDGWEGRVPTPVPVTPSVHRSASPGSRLVREWRGRTHVVDVTETGFRWNSEEHRSLSAIARKITGARWSGPRFFGL
jgi:hypothetical protein